MPRIEQSAVRNSLLAALPPDAFALLADHLRPAALAFKAVLHEPDRPIRTVYFPEGGMVSHVIVLGSGQGVEVGVAGREGLVGLPVILGDGLAATEAMVQAEADAWAIGAAELRAAFDRSTPLRDRLLRYAQAFHAQVSQTAACNAEHQVDVRLARWMLMLHDRNGGDTFPMTHEFLALMLAARRPSVSVAASTLQRSGAISYVHGKVTVLDRAALEAAACECYGAVRERYDGLLGATPPPGG